jgi:hypothetical protein
MIAKNTKIVSHWKKIHTCKWLFTWYIVNPGTLIVLKTPLGVAPVSFENFNWLVEAQMFESLDEFTVVIHNAKTSYSPQSQNV